MKTKELLIALAALITAGCFFQTAWAQAPNDVQDFQSHGIHVILRSAKANQVVSAVLGFEGGLAYGETDNAAVANITALVISQSGSDKFPIEAYRDSLARLSTSISGSGDIYHMVFTIQTIRPNFNTAWEIFSDLLVHPHYDTTEIAKITEQTITGIESRQSNPGGYTSFLADSIWTGASKLNRIPTTDEVEHLTSSDYMNYRNQQFQRSRAVLVVVGNVDRAELERKLATLGELPQGTFAWPKVEKVVPQTGQFTFIPRELPTTYIEMRTNSASISNPDWWAERVLVDIMGKRLFDEVRTKRNLAYSPGLFPGGSYDNYTTHISVQSVLPDSATRVIFNEIQKVQNTLPPSDELKNAKEGRITTYYYSTETNLSQANALYNDQVEGGDWRLFFQLVPRTEQVTAEQIRDIARKYYHNFDFVLMGPEGKSTKEVYHYQ